MGDLANISVEELAGKAQKLARLGMITGEAALALIIWPHPVDMALYVKAQRKTVEEIVDEILDLAA